MKTRESLGLLGLSLIVAFCMFGLPVLVRQAPTAVAEEPDDGTASTSSFVHAALWADWPDTPFASWRGDDGETHIMCDIKKATLFLDEHGVLWVYCNDDVHLFDDFVEQHRLRVE